AFGCALVGPSLQQLDLRVAQRLLADERTVGRIRLPRWHETLLRHRYDLRGAALRVVIGEQAERRRAAGVMTHAAALDEQRRDVLRECYLERERASRSGRTKQNRGERGDRGEKQ